MEELSPGYINARAEMARNVVEAAGGRVTGITWRQLGDRHEKRAVLFEMPGEPVPLYGVGGKIIVGERGEGFYSGEIVLDPKKDKAA